MVRRGFTAGIPENLHECELIYRLQIRLQIPKPPNGKQYTVEMPGLRLSLDAELPCQVSRQMCGERHIIYRQRDSQIYVLCSGTSKDDHPARGFLVEASDTVTNIVL